METSQNLAIESFSFNWLSNKKLCLDSLCEGPSRKSIELFDERTSEETTKSSPSIIFHFPTSKPPHNTIVHADEIFSHGLILPKYTEKANKEIFVTSYSVPSSPNSFLLQRNSSPKLCLLRKWQKASGKILQKYFAFFRPPCREIGFTRTSVRVDDVDGKYRAAKSLNNSPQSSPPRVKIISVENLNEMKKGNRKAKSMNSSPYGSPPRITPYCSSNWSVDSSIDEAILHCKRSFGK